MSRSDLFLWAARYQFPCLVLSASPLLILCAGIEYWLLFLSQAQEEHIELARARIAYWEQKFGLVQQHEEEAVA